MDTSQQLQAEEDFIKSRGVFSSPARWLGEKAGLDQKHWGFPPGLWVIDNKAYDLSTFAESHPGGSHWIRLTQGQNITEHFNVHHLRIDVARKVLAKYEVKDAVVNQKHRFTFKEDGLYMRIKRRVLQTYTPQHLQDCSQSKRVAVMIGLAYLICLWGAAYLNSYLLMVLAGGVMVGLLGLAHNFLHLKDDGLAKLFNIPGFNFKDWQVYHALSHHLYPNTGIDYELGVFQPLVHFIGRENPWYTELYLQPFYVVMMPVNILLSLIFPLLGRNPFNPYILLTFVQIPIIMLMGGLQLSEALILYFILQASAGYIFTKTVFCGHRLRRLWFEGDGRVEDFGQHTARSSNDNQVGWGALGSFLLFSGFNIHIAHHLFPTIDHSRLKLVQPIVMQQLKRAGIAHNHSSKLECMVEYSRCVLSAGRKR